MIKVTISGLEEQLALGAKNLHLQAILSLDRQLITAVLKHHQGNFSNTAKSLGLSRLTLRTRIREMGIQYQPAEDEDGASGSRTDGRWDETSPG